MKIGIIGKGRYIDADKLIEHLNAKSKNDYEMGLYHHGALTESFIRFVERQTTADVVEVRHGEWGFDGMGWTCSQCGEYALSYKAKIQVHSVYCPNCGAKMDGGRRENEAFTVAKGYGQR